jgi:hypothetical protein
MIKRLIKKTHLFPILKKLESMLLQQKAKRQTAAAQIRLTGASYQEVKFLGAGKDGITFKAKLPKGMVVVKVLSEYAKLFLPITVDLKRKISDIEETYCFEIIQGDLLQYEYENLVHLQNFTVKEFAQTFMFICDLQIKLLSRGVVIWDFGFTDPNYMLTQDGEIKWIDYGGNGFLYLDKNAAPMSPPRKNLVFANNEFVILSVLLHWLCFAIGNTQAIQLMSKLQDAKLTFSEAFSLLTTELQGTSISVLLELKDYDLLSDSGWFHFKEMLEALVSSDSKETLESADINSVDFSQNTVVVRGYQNYEISRDKITPKNLGHEWALSLEKWTIVDSILSTMTDKGSYLDIGCNLGMYVFSANLNYGFKAYGVDYNEQYVDQCSKIAKHLDLDCSFGIDKFSDISLKVDCVSALGIIHHLFHRTEQYSALPPIFERFASITNKYLIIEFPNEHDSKAKKWTNMRAKKIEEKYSEENFVAASSKHFRVVKKYEGAVSTRPIYLFEKSAS